MHKTEPVPYTSYADQHTEEVLVGNTSIRVSIHELDVSESEESEWTQPVLTPTSSTASLRTLYVDDEALCEAFMAHTGPAFEVPLSQEVSATVASNIPQYKTDKSKDNENGINSISRSHSRYKLRRPFSALRPRTENRPTQGLSRQHRQNIASCGTCGLGINDWSPTEEIAKAQSRFKRYGKTTPVRKIDDHHIALSVYPSVTSSASGSCQIRIRGRRTIREPKEEIPWWDWLVSAVTKICPARVDRIDINGPEIRHMPGAFDEADVQGIVKPRPVELGTR